MVDLIGRSIESTITAGWVAEEVGILLSNDRFVIERCLEILDTGWSRDVVLSRHHHGENTHHIVLYMSWP